jgi:hypothetical protein
MPAEVVDAHAEVPIGRAWQRSSADVLCARSVRRCRARIGRSSRIKKCYSTGAPVSVAAWTLRSTARRYRSFTLNSVNMPSSVCGGPSVGASMVVVPTGTKHATE